ncbi:MAG: hypothetical protein KatS3mg110_0405 [Pirellulaceae bacterium]|nr:MAG: hypothetical protein KatS3mg110_0405 [Pirellulaceae bacterium]
MRFGLRRPSIRKRIAARTSWRRYLRHSLGLKAPRGFGWLTNPRRALYNRIYYRTTRPTCLVGVLLVLLTGIGLAATVTLGLHGSGQELPRILILGDSISIGYTPYVQELLASEAVVLRPMLDDKRPENCQGTTYGLQHLDRWLESGGGRWDVIHFNFGLHDLKRVDPTTGRNSNDPDDPRQAEPDVYARQLEAIVQRLKKTGAKLIFATTTPVPEGKVTPWRDASDPPRYNELARQVMARHNVEVNDLYGAVLPRLHELQRPANVHFTEKGSRFLAEHVATAIRKALMKNKGE